MIITLSGKMQSGKDACANIIQYLTAKNIGAFAHKDLIAGVGIHGSHNSRFTNRKFATKIKETVALWTNCKIELLESDKFKDAELGEEWKRYFIMPAHGTRHFSISCNNDIHDNHNMYYSSFNEAYNVLGEEPFTSTQREFHVNSEVLTRRKLLQLVGTYCGRNLIHPNIWINTMFSEYTLDSGNNPWYANIDQFHVTEQEELEHPYMYPDWIISDLRYKNEDAVCDTKDRRLAIRINRPIELRYPELYANYITSSKYKGDNEKAFLEWLNVYDNSAWAKLTHTSETDLDDHLHPNIINNNYMQIHQLIVDVRDILVANDVTVYR